MTQPCPLARPVRSATLMSFPPLSRLLPRAPIERARLESAGRLPHWPRCGLARSAGGSLVVSRLQLLVVEAVGPALVRWLQSVPEHAAHFSPRGCAWRRRWPVPICKCEEGHVSVKRVSHSSTRSGYMRPGAAESSTYHLSST